MRLWRWVVSGVLATAGAAGAMEAYQAPTVQPVKPAPTVQPVKPANSIEPFLAQTVEVWSGPVRFRAPAGWRRIQDEKLLRFVPPDLPAGKQAFLAVTPGEQPRDGLRAWLEAIRKGVQEGERELQSGPVTTSRSSGGCELASAAAATEGDGGKQWHRTYVAAGTGKGSQMFVFAASDSALQQRYAPVIEAFARVLAAEVVAAAGATPAAAGGQAPAQPTVPGSGTPVKRPAPRRVSVVGTWRGVASSAGNLLVLKADGTYTYNNLSKGSYSVAGEQVRFRTGALTAWDNGRASLKDENLEFYWTTPAGARQWFVFTKTAD